MLQSSGKIKGEEGFNYVVISAQAMKIGYDQWEQLMIALQEDGYIKGLVYSQGLTDKFPHIAEPIQPRITLKGMEYLANNSMMAKAKEALKLIGEIV